MNRVIRTSFLALAACLALSCAAPRAVDTVTADKARVYPPLNVLPVEFGDVKTGLVRGIVGAPEEMLDTAVRNAGSFGVPEARELRNAVSSEARGAGFGGDSEAKPLAVRVRVLTYLARVGELWPRAAYLVEAEYSVTGPGSSSGQPRGVYMYYSAWLYWSMQSLRKDVMKSLAEKIIRDIAGDPGGGAGGTTRDRGRAKFFNDLNVAREEFFGE
jgi:hypothetical protein